MEFKDIVASRRSVRKFSDRSVEREKIERLIDVASAAPSSRNSHSTRFMVVENRELIESMATMRDYGSAFIAKAPALIVVLGDKTLTDLWEVNASIAATTLQLACVDEGLASCWVHIDGRARLQEQPQGESALEYLRTLLPICEQYEALCLIALGYSDFTPKPLPIPTHEDTVVYWE